MCRLVISGHCCEHSVLNSRFYFVDQLNIQVEGISVAELLIQVEGISMADWLMQVEGICVDEC